MQVEEAYALEIT